jgi:hypothetical protein
MRTLGRKEVLQHIIGRREAVLRFAPMPQRFPTLVSALAASSIAALSACTTTAPDNLDGGGNYPLWSSDVLSGANPFPDSRLIGTDGGMGARPRLWQPFLPADVETVGGVSFQTFMTELAHALQPLGGFGNYGAILLPFSAEADPATLPAAASYLATAGNGSLGPTADVAYHADLTFAEIHPDLPLQPGQAYVLVLTDAAKDTTGKAMVRSPDFAVFASSGQGQALVSQAAQILGTSTQHIIFAMQFQTESTSDLQTLAVQVTPAPSAPYAVDIPTTPVPVSACSNLTSIDVQCPRGVFTKDAGLDELMPWFTASLVDGGDGGGIGYQDPPDDVGMVIAGGVTLKDVRDAEAGTFQSAAVADPFGSGRDVQREFVVVTPDPATMPDGGFPMVLVGHGLGQRNTLWVDSSGKPEFSECVMLAEFFTKAGFGCIGIDSPSHGTRGNWGVFFDFADLLATRDNLREMAFDQMQMQRFAASWPAGNLGITIDPNRLTYFGVSLGGIMGGNFMSLDPRTRHGVLNVPGGGLYQIFESPNIFNELGLVLAQINLGIPFNNVYDGGVNPDFVASLPFLEAAAQSVLEPGDPINNATLFGDAGTRHVLMQEGLLDQTVPNHTTNSLAGTLGVPTLQAAASGTDGVSGLWKYDLTQYGLDPTKVNPHETFFVIPQARDQVAHYLDSSGNEIIAE